MEKLTFPAQAIKTAFITFWKAHTMLEIVAPSFFFKMPYFMKKWKVVKRAYFFTKLKYTRELFQMSRSEIFGTATTD